MATIFKYDRERRRVDVALHHANTTPDVYWSPRRPGGGGFNSYVLVEGTTHRLRDGRTADLVSINGAGEVRWHVEDWALKSAIRHEEEFRDKGLYTDDEEYLGAARHFGLIPGEPARMASSLKPRMWDFSGARGKLVHFRYIGQGDERGPQMSRTGSTPCMLAIYPQGGRQRPLSMEQPRNFTSELVFTLETWSLHDDRQWAYVRTETASGKPGYVLWRLAELVR